MQLVITSYSIHYTKLYDQLVQVNVGADFIYRQSGGILNIDTKAEKAHEHPVFELRESTSTFEMTGGQIVIIV